MTYQAIQTLPNTPLDIIGDVHGEFTALQALLHHLGYDATGYHPEGRTLVFVGDLYQPKLKTGTYPHKIKEQIINTIQSPTLP